MNTQREDKVMFGREEVEDVKEFVYLGMSVTKEGGGTEDIKKRLSKAREAFFNLKKIWNTWSIGRNTKDIITCIIIYVYICIIENSPKRIHTVIA